jgi:hypothetical protein
VFAARYKNQYFQITVNTLTNTIEISITIPSKKTGMDILVGMAVRFITKVASIATRAGMIRSVSNSC